MLRGVWKGKHSEKKGIVEISQPCSEFEEYSMYMTGAYSV